MARLIVIGDVHGCLAELDALLTDVAPRPDDELVLVGDLVRKGPDSAGVVRRVREIGARAVRGNHDVHFIQRGEATALSAEERAWLESLPLFLRLPGHG